MGFLGMVGAAYVGVWVFASSVCFFRGAARLAAYVLVTLKTQTCSYTAAAAALLKHHMPRTAPAAPADMYTDVKRYDNATSRFRFGGHAQTATHPS